MGNYPPHLIPKDIYHNIVSTMSVKSILACIELNKFIQSIAITDLVWKPLVIKNYKPPTILTNYYETFKLCYTLTILSSDIKFRGTITFLHMCNELIVDHGVISRPLNFTPLTNLKTLHLTGAGLHIFPLSICKLHNLQLLNLDDNNLVTLPSEIKQLVNLQRLWLENNKLISLPSELYGLTTLSQLCLRNNRLTTLSPEIGKLVNLHFLWIKGNCLTNLPFELTQLTQLRDLKLDNTIYDSLPPEMNILKTIFLS